MSEAFKSPQWYETQIQFLHERLANTELREASARLAEDKMRRALTQRLTDELCGARFDELPCDALVCVSKPHGPEDMHTDAHGVRWP